jgi:hypothetical protein
VKRFFLVASLVLQTSFSEDSFQNPLAVGDVSRENAKPLPAIYVNDMFKRTEKACEAKNVEATLDQISNEQRNFILQNKSATKPLFEHISYICKDMATIKNNILSVSPNPSYATFTKRGSARLCFYVQDKNDRQCKGELRVAFENGKLKINEH